MKVTAVVGTAKGGFILRSDERRERWEVSGPIFKGWKVTAVTRDGGGRWLAATASDVYGPAIHESDDLEDWRQLPAGPAYTPESGRAFDQVWKLVASGERLWAGVSEAGLFTSEDGGATWSPVSGLNDHPSREIWQPGAGGLCAHTLLFDPRDPRRIWCGISAVGVFRSDDGGRSWNPKNRGVPICIEDERFKDIGCCVHALAADPGDPDVIYRQDHVGVFVTRDGGDHWERIETGLPSVFGFPIVVDPRSKALFVVPLEKDEYRIPAEGRFQVFRSTDGGARWEARSNGLPQDHAYMSVLRSAMAADGLEPGGLYVGTTAGTVHLSADRGESWTTLPSVLPRILTVSVFVEP